MTEECATYLMLTPWRDETTGESHRIRSVDEAQSMARDFFVIKGPQRHQLEVEEANVVKGTGKKAATRAPASARLVEELVIFSGAARTRRRRNEEELQV